MRRRQIRGSVIALLTDFGTKDGFVGTMKAVILSINPEAKIIDLSHEIPPQDIEGAAYVLWSSYRYFPKGTIFVVVVDPGVGTKRRILCAEGRAHSFLAPDNGVLKYVLSEGEIKKMWEVRNIRYALEPLSSTFHGRDVFAPAAAHLSRGLDPGRLGRRTRVNSMPEEFVPITARRWKRAVGKVIHIDRFGNLITNFRVSSVKGLFVRTFKLRIRNRVVRELSRSYAGGSEKGLLALVNSADLIEISLKNGNASKSLRAKVGERVSIEITG